MRAMLALLLVAGALAGCLGGSDESQTTTTGPIPTDTSWAANALYAGGDPEGQDFVVGHDHSDRALHQNLSTPNFEVLGHDPLSTGYHGAPSGGYYCGGVSRDGERQYAVVNSFTSNVAVVVVDVTDPAEVRMVGELVLTNTHIYDADVTEDGAYVVLATSPLDPLFPDPNDPAPSSARDAVRREAALADRGPQSRTVQAQWRGCAGAEGPLDEIPYGGGIMLVDLSDPTSPAVADFVSTPALGPHSVSTAEVDGTRFAVASVTNLAYTASTFDFFTVEDTPLGGKLVPYGAFSAHYDQQANTEGDVLLNGHVDATLHEHPGTGEAIAYLANWDAGLTTVRLDGPGQITELATWGARDPDAGSGMTGSIHSAMPLDVMWGDRHITVTGQEVGSRPAGRPTGQIVLLDTTDPADPQPVARWTLPVDVQWSGDLHFSTHYPAMVDQTLFVASYHAGVWAADASEAHWPNLPSLGVFVPAADSGSQAVTDTAYAPNVPDVLALRDGSLVAFDSTSGAYTLRFHDDGSVAPAAPWDEDMPVFGG